MKKPVPKSAVAIALLIVLAALAVALTSSLRASPDIENAVPVDRIPNIHPDYTDIVIPPNIAPLNFRVHEPAVRYHVRIHSENGVPIEITVSNGTIDIPQGQWSRLIAANRGRPLSIEVFAKADDGRWSRFLPITNTISDRDIDTWLVYRKMHPTHLLRNGTMAAYQRNLTTFDEQLVIDRAHYKNGCQNCHLFCNNDPRKAILGVRTGDYGTGTLLVQGDHVTKIGTKFGYASWHPTGKLIAYTVTNLPIFFHSAADQTRDTVNFDSALACFRVDSATVTIAPPIADKEYLEIWPCWSADGRYLYFCRTRKPWSDLEIMPPPEHSSIKYDLVRVSYDIDADRWGEIETVLSAQDTHRTIAVPRISPDGRWLLFTMFSHGCFPAWRDDSDAYIIDLHAAAETGRYEYKPVAFNSDKSESWYTWSANSVWLAFSSKRENGVFTRLYLTSIDLNGNFSKPFIVPQQDPDFYDSCLLAFNTAEFADRPFPVNPEALASVIRRNDPVEIDMPITMATPQVQSDYNFGLGKQDFQ